MEGAVYVKYLQPVWDGRKLQSITVEFLGFVKQETDDCYLLERFLRMEGEGGEKLFDNTNRYVAVLKSAVLEMLPMAPKEVKKDGKKKK